MDHGDGTQTYNPGVVIIKGILAKRFDGLALDQQRGLVRTLLDVRVRRGAGADRLQINER
jgi:hypothetical protein